MFEVGDKVRFIDEALEGTITAIVGKDRAAVLTNDGFSQVALLSQLVKVRMKNAEQRESSQAVAAPVAKAIPEPTKLKKGHSKIFAFNETNLKEEVIYAVFEVLDRESPLTSAVQFHLVNNTDSTIA